MLEDGEIDYEFFHEPGKAMVHPALGRLAFLIEPDGVKVHRITDAQHDRTGLTPTTPPSSPTAAGGPPRPRSGPGPGTGSSSPWPATSSTLTLNDVLDLRAADRADQPARLRPVPLRRRDRGPGPQRHLPGRMAPALPRPLAAKHN